MRASCRVKLDLDDGSSVDTGQWFGWGNGEVTFTLTQSLVPDQELAEVSKAQFYGTATLDGEEVEWRSPTIYRRRLGRKTTPDVVVKFKGRPAGQKPGAEGELRSESDRASARDALVEFDVRYRGSGAPFSGRLSIDWIHSPKDSAASRGDSRGKRLPSGRYQANVPVGSVTFTLKDASASGSLPSWTGAASTKRSGKTLVFAELDEGAVVDVQRPKGWRGEWFVRASYRENPDDPWFGSWNYSSPTSSLQLTSLKPAEWRFQLRRSSNGASEETRTAVLVPGDSVVVE